jgi:tetratricopeptide (TPR) repeat protein
MVAETNADPKLELGHVLFIDIVGYSKLLINDQSEFLRLLNETVRGSAQYRSAEARHRILRLPTGDGMALVFRSNPDEPARCALEVSEALKAYPAVRVRMGIHSGPVSRVADVIGRTNIAGAGINIAQRIMDCGEAGHILVSKRIAEDLENYREWQSRLHDLGQCEVKHGVMVSVSNLYTDTLGNPEIPPKFKRSRWKPARQRGTSRPLKQLLIGCAVLFAIGGLVVWQFHRRAEIKAEPAKLRQGILEYPQIDAQLRGSRTENEPVAEQERIYVELGKQLGVDPKTLREKLPRFADELKKAPTAGMYERASASYVAKDYAEAERLALQATADAKNNVPVQAKNVLAALQLAGLSAERAVEYPRAMQHFRDAENLTDRIRDLGEWAALQQDVADLLVMQGKYGDAEKIFRTIIQAQSSAVGPEHPDTLNSRHRLIYALTRQSKYAEAEAEARQVLKLREKILGPQHIDTIVSRYDLADSLVDQGKYPEAESLYREAIRLDTKALGPDHPRTQSDRVGLATVLSSEGKNSEAEPLYREIIQLDEKVYGPEHPNTLNDRQNLATALQADHKYGEAEAEYRYVIKIDQKIVGPEHPDTLICRNNLAEMLDDEGKYADAEAECRQIVPLEQKVLGPENRVTLNSRGNLAVALLALGKFPEAQLQYQDVLKLMVRVLGLEHPDTLSYASKFTTALVHRNKTPEAKALAKHLEEEASQKLGPESEPTQNYAQLLAKLEAENK